MHGVKSARASFEAGICMRATKGDCAVVSSSKAPHAVTSNLEKRCLLSHCYSTITFRVHWRNGFLEVCACRIVCCLLHAFT